jgi:monovalent cation/hydrogen antiporter
VRQAAIAQYEGYLAAQKTIDHARSRDDQGGRRGRTLESVLRRASDAERRLVLDARRRGDVSAASADEVLRDIENRALRDFD